MSKTKEEELIKSIDASAEEIDAAMKIGDNATTSISDMFAEINSLIEEDEEEEVVNGVRQKQQQRPADNKDEVTKNKTPKADITTEEPVVNDDEDETEEDDDEKVAINPFSKKPSKKQVNFDGIDSKNFFPVIGKRLGIEIKDEKDIKTLARRIDDLRASSQNLKKVQSELEEFKSFISGLPAPLKSAMKAAYENPDKWRDELSKDNTLDVSKDFSELTEGEKKSLVEHFYGEVPESGYTPIQIKTAESLYNKERSILQKAAQDEANKVARFKENFNTSLQTSASLLKKEYPDFDEKVVASLKAIIKTGGFRSLFFDESGLVKPEALKLLAFAKYGEKYASSLVQRRQNKKRSEEEVDIVRGSNKSPSVKGFKSNGGKNATVPNSVKELMEFKQFQKGVKKFG